ncbi:MAG TPA: P1 family peptidase [Gemmatimonadota bacterium]|nr:P1 family peptidase [Gemmatimonadota bacterium]
MRARARLAVLALGVLLPAAAAGQEARPRARDLGIVVGALPPGPLDAITDVPGVRVGHVTVVEGDSIRSGVTVVVPHEGNVFLDKVPGAIHVANGFGKLAGVTQVRELGTIETPIALTNTLAVGRVVDGLARWTRARTGDDVRSVNAVVGETNDGFLNAIGVPRIGVEEVRAALDSARGGPVREGSVGAGTGTTALGFKGGIGTASRRVRIGDTAWTLGVLVQSNFGGALEIAGVPVGRRMGKAGFLETWIPFAGGAASDSKAGSPAWRAADQPDAGGGSIMVVVATDAPVDADGLERIARRAPYGIGRVGGFSAHGSGDYVIAFSNHPEVRVPHAADGPLAERRVLRGEALDPLFLAVVEATEEAILNSLLAATTVTGWRGTSEAIPIDPLREMLTRD